MDLDVKIDRGVESSKDPDPYERSERLGDKEVPSTEDSDPCDQLLRSV